MSYIPTEMCYFCIFSMLFFAQIYDNQWLLSPPCFVLLFQIEEKAVNLLVLTKIS